MIIFPGILYVLSVCSFKSCLVPRNFFKLHNLNFFILFLSSRILWICSSFISIIASIFYTFFHYVSFVSFSNCMLHVPYYALFNIISFFCPDSSVGFSLIEVIFPPTHWHLSSANSCFILFLAHRIFHWLISLLWTPVLYSNYFITLSYFPLPCDNSMQQFLFLMWFSFIPA